MTQIPDEPSPDEQKPKKDSKKFRVPTLVAVGIGVVAAKSLGGSDAENRYPLRTEYEIAKSCTDSSGSSLYRNDYLTKQEWCLCALENTTNKVSYAQYSSDYRKFSETFVKSINTCKKSGRR